jgi:hypothetical protein
MNLSSIKGLVSSKLMNTVHCLLAIIARPMRVICIPVMSTSSLRLDFETHNTNVRFPSTFNASLSDIKRKDKICRIHGHSSGTQHCRQHEILPCAILVIKDRAHLVKAVDQYFTDTDICIFFSICHPADKSNVAPVCDGSSCLRRQTQPNHEEDLSLYMECGQRRHFF